MKNYKNMFSLMGVGMVAILVAGCGSGTNSSGHESSGSTGNHSSLTLAWWGSQPRVTSTKKAITLFEKDNPNVSVSSVYASWDGYWSKLATLVAGGTTPDVMQMDEAYLMEYADKGTIADLNNAGVDLSKLDPNALNEGKIGGKLYGIPTGVNAYGLLYDPKVIQKAGVNLNNSDGLTWSKFENIALEISKKDKGVYGTQDGVEFFPLFEYWVRDKGEQLYSSDGKSLGFSKDTLVQWFDYWNKLVKEGAAEPASSTLSYNYSDGANYPIVKGKTAIAFIWSNQYSTFEQYCNRPVKMALLPDWNSSNKPYYLHPSMYWSLSSTTHNKKEAAKLLDYLENNSQVAKAFGTDRGVPINSNNKTKLYRSSAESDKAQINFINRVELVAGPDNVYPPAYGQMQDQFVTIAQEVISGKLSSSAGAEQFMSQAQQDLSQSS
ncbi:ABC transporter substrate-binding protein [Alicyclobacillus shizuokensis]|uniref:ABC transporter substrate-binding protein n=1 Tax=Alicyclobacillus shizuokensis TaxID=392014 RepID=UPI00083245AF|nr:extracellular solute-binding protein [Alicyclobacillus shizuokensis]MCL6625493.1 extracellular solute-binding protein [Alicyclobacillus shizuokensis]